MKIYRIGIIKNDSKPSMELCAYVNPAAMPRFYTDTVKEYLTMFSKTVAERTQPGQRQSIEEQGKFLHVYARSEGVAGVLVADEDYPKMTAHAVLSKVLDEFVTQNPRSSWQSGRPVAWEKQLQKAVEENKDPNAAGGIGQIQRELDETKVVLHKTIENVLERGEKIDNLVAKSADLNDSSKKFYATAKSKNSCCLIM